MLESPDSLPLRETNPVIDVPVGGHYSPVNIVWGDIFGGDTVHYDTVSMAVMRLLETTELGACLAVNATVFIVILMLSHDY